MYFKILFYFLVGKIIMWIFLIGNFRYILVDWLVEIVGMKDFFSYILYIVVSVVDRYLKVYKIFRFRF